MIEETYRYFRIRYLEVVSASGFTGSEANVKSQEDTDEGTS